MQWNPMLFFKLVMLAQSQSIHWIDNSISSEHLDYVYSAGAHQITDHSLLDSRIMKLQGHFVVILAKPFHPYSRPLPRVFNDSCQVVALYLYLVWFCDHAKWNCQRYQEGVHGSCRWWGSGPNHKWQHFFQWAHFMRTYLGPPNQGQLVASPK